MKLARTIGQLSLGLTLLVGLSACSNLSHRQQNAAVGAGVGAVAGSILTNGSTIGTLGGAAIGGIIGNGGTDTHHKH